MPVDPKARADAADRAYRTLFQAAIASVLVAAGTATLDILGSEDRLSAVDWVDLLDRVGYVSLVGFLIAGVAFFQRLREG